MTEGRTYINPAGDRALQKGNIRHLRYVFGYLKPYKKELFIVFVALIIAASAVLSLGKGLKYLIDEGFGKQNPAFLDISLLILFGIIFVLALASYTRFYFITKVGESVVADIRRDVFSHILKLSPGFFEVTRTGEVLSRLTTDTSIIQLVVGSSLSVALRNTLMLIGGLIMLLATSPKLTAYIAIMVPLVVLQILTLGRKVRGLSRISQDRVADISSHSGEVLGSIKVVQAYSQESHEKRRINNYVNDAFGAAMDRVKMRAKLTAIVILLVFGSIGLVLWVGGKDVLSGNLSAGELSAFVFYAVLVASSFAAISEVIGDLQRAAGASERLIEILHAESDIKISENPKKIPEDIKPSVKFDDVSFYYPTRTEHPALDTINFEVKPGQTLALVGPSGAGKSTILQLLLRFYDAQGGKITIGGINVKDTQPRELRDLFAFVSQDAVVFSDSAYENIKYGMQNATQNQVIEAAKAARAHDFIEKLPEGYDTFLGEKGVRLSGGEKQRIALARAILRDPKILLLDEATSSLDAENEKLVQEALEKVMENRTTIVIAHRLATVLKSDNIAVINNGRIESMGTHEELVAQGTLYSRLAELQFSQ